MFVLEDKPSDQSKVVDVVAVHGLNGHYLNTWKTTNAAGEDIVWIRDFLPKQLPNARIMSYGYNSAVQFSKSVVGIGTFAEQLLEDLRSWRLTPEEKERPVIFICHSLGGIVVKQALVRAHERERFSTLLSNIRGIAFFGTPHRGADLASWAAMFGNILNAAGFGTSTSTKFLKELRSRSELLSDISESFVERGKDLDIFSFYETDMMGYMNYLLIDAQTIDVTDAITSYFFFKDDNEQQRTATLAISGLLHQIFTAQPQLLKHGVQWIKSRSVNRMEFNPLWKLFTDTIQDIEATSVICLIDALDECEKMTREIFIAVVAKYFATSLKSQQRKPVLKMLVTSRPDNAIQRGFQRLQKIRLRGEDEVDSVSHDIGLVVQANIDQLQEGGMPRWLLMNLQQRLIDGADRTFLWTTLIIQLLKDASEQGASQNQLEAIIQSRDIDEVYSRLLQQTSSPLKARALLSIVLAVARPLTLNEMCVATAIRLGHKNLGALERDFVHPFENHVRTLCGHFLRIIHGKIYLVHQTAREFLLDFDSHTASTVQYGDLAKEEWIDRNYAIKLGKLDKLFKPSRDHNRGCVENGAEHRSKSYPLPLRQVRKQTMEVGREIKKSSENGKNKRLKPVKRELFKHGILLKNAHYLLLKACIHFISIAGNSDDKAMLLLDPCLEESLDYAALTWAFHSGHCRDVQTLPVMELLEKLCSPQFPGFATWTQRNSLYRLQFPEGRIDIQGKHTDHKREVGRVFLGMRFQRGPKSDDQDLDDNDGSEEDTAESEEDAFPVDVYPQPKEGKLAKRSMGETTVHSHSDRFRDYRRSEEKRIAIEESALVSYSHPPAGNLFPNYLNRVNQIQIGSDSDL
ncbi:hypothetical protein G7Y89_g6554 [Cudoniella acicularis]|uniref:DUF676 domain-containing protein n=1 Tax=Cudoniella acicularis TaxID=354080 RepID=A0A8H4RM14_9HELO|nr:hypothetical protein G7Y89_g6554 [Cudoniella acicularis]